ncbi:MAG: phosphopyruvate hydratase, partial [Christensenellales bacterium]
MAYCVEDVKARQILDSRGNPTVEVDVFLAGGGFGRFSVPSGASTGSFEALELRDGDKNNYGGKSVEKAVENVNKTIKSSIIHKSFENFEELDKLLILLDGTKNKSKLGANAVLGVSGAFVKAVANKNNVPVYELLKGKTDFVLPTPMMNIINGGKHSDNNINIQEFMIVPTNCDSFKTALKKCVEVYHTLKNLLKKDGYLTSVGDEGGFAPNFSSDEMAIDYILQAIVLAGFEPKKDFYIALDIAASEMKNEAQKNNMQGYYFWKSGKLFTSEEFVQYWINLCEKYPIISLEDPFDEQDYESYKIFNQKMGSKIQIVGDDLFVTNIERLKVGIKEKLANSILIKPNQIGSFSETLETIECAKKSGFKCIISH